MYWLPSYHSLMLSLSMMIEIIVMPFGILFINQINQELFYMMKNVLPRDAMGSFYLIIRVLRF